MTPNHQKVIELYLQGKEHAEIKKETGLKMSTIRGYIYAYLREQNKDKPKINIEQEGDDETMGLFNKKPVIEVPSPPPQYNANTTNDRLDITNGQTNKQQQTEEQGKIPLFARYDEATYMQLQFNQQMIELQKQLITEIIRLRETIERVSK